MEQISKASLSPDWSLQLDSMKLESLVIPNQNVGVNTFPGVVHRTGDWGEVVTRYPYGNVGMDHLLSKE